MAEPVEGLMLLNLMRSELSRLRYRRRVWGSLIIMGLVGVFAPAMWADQIPEPSADTLILARADLVQMQITGQCADCTIDDLIYHMSFDSMISTAFPQMIMVMAFLVFMIVITYVAADFASGALATQLTFTPRRSVLLAARSLASGVLGLALIGVGMVAMVASAIVTYLSINSINSIGPAPGLLQLVVCGLLYGFLLGVIAALVSFIIRNTALAMAAAVVVLMVNLSIDQAGLPGQSIAVHLMPLSAGMALLFGEAAASYFGAGGAVVAVIISRGEAIVFHLGVILVLAALATFLFQRRDVKG